MEVVLDVQEWIVRSRTYYRVLIPKKLSDALGLTRGSKIKLEVKQVIDPKTSNLEQKPLGNPECPKIV